ncbi:Uncharacterized protein TCM_007693 [Theobroma cacao]|uniref:Dihydroorotate dehydrogenase catalytic domain-containing protein n=1 Tax=Theobroma cacao TaxID=3641 RepID=A0A061E9W2_THECC|nr:Uncharacterized protein TCM_007693 [Theobroma cacao]
MYGNSIGSCADVTCEMIYGTGKIPLIGCGGISSGEDACNKIRAGVTLVQLYTAFAYGGPALIPQMKAELAECLERDGFKSVHEAVGADCIYDLPNVKLMITYGGHWVNDTYKGGETRVRGVGSDLSFSGLVKLVKEVVGVNSHNNEIELHTSFSHASEIEDDVEENDTADRNDELCYDCEDDFVCKHKDRSEDDRVEQTYIPDCNHADGGTGHTTTVVLEEVELDDHGRTVELEDVEGTNPIYDNTIALENDIRSPDDSDQERVNTRGSRQWIILGLDMISFQTVGSEEFKSMDDYLYREKVFLSKAELKRTLSMLALKEHFEFRVKKSCHVHFEKVHTCTVDGLHCRYRTASARVIGELISSRVQGNCVTSLRRKEIIEEMNRKWGLQCLYGKAWQAKEFKREDVVAIFTMAANCYRVTDFDRHMNQLKQLCKLAYESLMRLGPEMVSANVQPLNYARTITRLDLGRRDMRFPFARFSILVSGTSPMTFNKLSFCHQVGKVKREDLRGKGIHQLGKAADNVDVHNARAMVIIDKIIRLRLHLNRQTGKHHLLSRRLDDVDPRHVQFTDNSSTSEIAVQCGLQTLITKLLKTEYRHGQYRPPPSYDPSRIWAQVTGRREPYTTESYSVHHLNSALDRLEETTLPYENIISALVKKKLIWNNKYLADWTSHRPHNLSFPWLVKRGYDLSLDEPLNSVEGNPVHPAYDTSFKQLSRVLVSNDVMYNMLMRIDEKLSNQTARIHALELRIQNVENLLIQRIDTVVQAVEVR